MSIPSFGDIDLPAPSRGARPPRKPAGGGSDPATDPFGGLEGEDRDAYVAITEMLKAYGLESLAPSVLGFIQQGYNEATIGVLLQNTDAYKQRFKANEVRKQKGLPVLSPAEYLSVEQSYRQLMSSAGLPVGFYDEPTDFENWIAQDVSPVEVQQRVELARKMVNSIDPTTRETWRQWYSDGDMVAFALDRDRATTVVERQYRAAQIGAAAQDQKFGLDRQTAERLADLGVDQEQARQGFGVASAVTRNAQSLASVYGGTYTADDAVSEVFLADAEAGRKRRRLASQERAAFSGSANLNSESLSRNGAGQV